MFPNIKAAIFDLDGTLVDSMWVWDKIDKDYFNSINIPMPKNLKEEINHLSFEQTALYFKTKYNLTSSIEDIILNWTNMAIHEYSHEVPLKEGALDYIQYLKKNKIKIGLATSNSYPLLEATLKNNNIYHYFDTITTSSEVNKSKSNPDVYLLAAKKLGISPSSCVVFEDIMEGVLGAKSAGMKTVAVYDKYAIHQKNELINVADLYIENYFELLQ